MQCIVAQNAVDFGATNVIKWLGNIITKRSKNILNSYCENFGRFCPEFWGNQLYYNADDFGATNVIKWLGNIITKTKRSQNISNNYYANFGSFAMNFRTAIFIIVRMILGQQMLLHADNFVA